MKTLTIDESKTLIGLFTAASNAIDTADKMLDIDADAEQRDDIAPGNDPGDAIIVASCIRDVECDMANLRCWAEYFLAIERVKEMLVASELQFSFSANQKKHDFTLAMENAGLLLGIVETVQAEAPSVEIYIPRRDGSLAEILDFGSNVDDGAIDYARVIVESCGHFSVADSSILW